MSNVISNKVSKIDEDFIERFVTNFFAAIQKLAECHQNGMPVSMMLMIAQITDEEKGIAAADHTVYGDAHMHFENVMQLLYQFIEAGTNQHHHALRQMFAQCEKLIIKKESTNEHPN